MFLSQKKKKGKGDLIHCPLNGDGFEIDTDLAELGDKHADFISVLHAKSRKRKHDRWTAYVIIIALYYKNCKLFFLLTPRVSLDKV